MTPKCLKCDGKGYYYVQDGPDDVSTEPCEYCDKMEVRDERINLTA